MRLALAVAPRVAGGAARGQDAANLAELVGATRVRGALPLLDCGDERLCLGACEEVVEGDDVRVRREHRDVVNGREALDDTLEHCTEVARCVGWRQRHIECLARAPHFGVAHVARLASHGTVDDHPARIDVALALLSEALALIVSIHASLGFRWRTRSVCTLGRQGIGLAYRVPRGADVLVRIVWPILLKIQVLLSRNHPPRIPKGCQAKKHQQAEGAHPHDSLLLYIAPSLAKGLMPLHHHHVTCCHHHLSVSVQQQSLCWQSVLIADTAVLLTSDIVASLYLCVHISLVSSIRLLYRLVPPELQAAGSRQQAAGGFNSPPVNY